jgi:hypothetical protein
MHFGRRSARPSRVRRPKRLDQQKVTFTLAM